MAWLPDGEKIFEKKMFICFDTTHERDRQTHTHTQTPHDCIGRAALMHSIARQKLLNVAPTFPHALHLSAVLPL